MRNIWTKFCLLILSIVIFIGSWVFLLGQTQDILIKFIPSQTEVYLHTKTKNLQRLDSVKLNYFIDFLAKNSNISPETWQDFIYKSNKQISFFTINQQVFALTNSTSIISFLDNNNLSHLTINNNTYFPELKLDDSTLSNQAWYKQIKPKTYFNDFNLYIKNPNILDLNYSFNANEQLSLLIKGDLKENTLKLSMTDNINNKNYKKFPSESLNTNYIAYFNGITSKNLTQKADFSSNNFIYHLTQAIQGSFSLTKYSNKDTLEFSKELNTIENIKNSISSILAFVYPSEKSKSLPDGTIATHLIADPNFWNESFTEHTDSVPEFRIENTDKKFIIDIKDLGSTIKVEYIYNFTETNDPTILDINSILKDCTYFRPKSYIIINPSFFSSVSSLKRLVVSFGLFNKAYICID